MLINIVDGRPVGYISTKECAKINGVSWSLVRRNVREGKIDTLRIQHGQYETVWVPEDTKITKRKVGRNWTSERIGNYPENLIRYLGLENTWIGSTDQVAGLEYTIDQLSKIEKAILKKRFIDKRSYEEIGETVGLTRERVRQILIKLRAELKSEHNINYIVNGLNGENKRRANFKAHGIVEGSTDPVEILNLGVRELNCLRKGKIGTITELVNACIHDEDLIKIRGLGRTGIANIEKQLQLYFGLSNEEYRSFMSNEYYKRYILKGEQ